MRIWRIPTATGDKVEPCIEVLDGKNYSLIWTDNPKYNKKDIINDDRYRFHIMIKYNAKNDNEMMIDIGKLIVNSKKAAENGIPLFGDIFIKIINSRN